MVLIKIFLHCPCNLKNNPYITFVNNNLTEKVMNRFEEAKYDGYDFNIYRTEINLDGSKWFYAKCGDGSFIEAKLTEDIEDGEDPLVKAEITIASIEGWSESGTIYVDLDLDKGLTAENADKAIQYFIDENL
jgi:hypothetical protein